MSEPSGSFSERTVSAPAKINLGLKVLGWREDGFHEIETIFVAVDLFDELRFRRETSGGLRLTWEPAAPDFHAGDFSTGETNLIVRAARMVERECAIRVDLSVHLKKRIPIAAGLGGGSADAAATLAALERLYRPHVPSERLPEWAAQLGSDVPFFLGSPCAFGRGRGESLSPVSVNLNWWAVLICPHLAVPSRDVYAAFDLTSPDVFPDTAGSLDGEGLFAALSRIHNDLEPVVIRRVPDLSNWRARLWAMGALGVFVSGSGPTICGIFRQAPGPEQVNALRSGDAAVFVVRPLATPRALVIG
ncbi:MAG: 4-(cytidine 5'-diphospho)-2-C-methyl-D-erythritol kinase [candidate division Zixibacteria bacterium]|nr:4-(cytidine 5'-diphospho)-2-C-methyl-D-erythritol kinase [candidate division Zixibacteria bacterium]